MKVLDYYVFHGAYRKPSSYIKSALFFWQSGFKEDRHALMELYYKIDCLSNDEDEYI